MTTWLGGDVWVPSAFLKNDIATIILKKLVIIRRNDGIRARNASRNKISRRLELSSASPESRSNVTVERASTVVSELIITHERITAAKTYQKANNIF